MENHRIDAAPVGRLAKIVVTLKGELELLRMRLVSGTRGTDILDLQRLANDHAQSLVAGLDKLGSTADEDDIRAAALSLLADLAEVERGLSKQVLR